MKKNKKIIILTLIALIMILPILYFSYGFITTKILGLETTKRMSFLSNPLTVTYSDGTSVLNSASGETFTPGSTLTKTFSITNDSNNSFNFSLKLENVVNEFNRKDDIEYGLYLLDGNNEVIDKIITEKFPSEDKTIIYYQSINKDETLTYKLIINYKNSTENQIEDSGKSISAKITFDYAGKQ